MLNLIIPTYKARDTLPNALDSAVAQTKKNFMVTISQDHDGEDYSDIIAEYEHRGLHINLIDTQVNGGPGNARQYAMDHDSMSDYFMFMDSDDMLMPRAVEVLYTEAKRNNADLISSSFIREINHQPPSMMDVNKTPVTWTHGKIYRAQYLRDHNIRFLPELRLNEDSYFNLVAVNCTDKKYKITEYLYLWRDNPNSLTRAEEESTFFLKSWVQYLHSQIEGLKSIVKITNKLASNLAAATFINIYEQVMKAVYLNIDIEEPCSECLQLGKLEPVQGCIGDPAFWAYIANNLKASYYLGTTLVFCKIRFVDWLNKYVLGVTS